MEETITINNGTIPADYQAGYIVFDNQVNGVIGRLLTLLETLGLKESQEKALKDTARNILYDLYRDSLYASSSVVEIAQKENKKINASVS